jgi:hypothetical protein
VAQVRVAAGQTVTIWGLPEGVTYDIVEVPVTNYTVTATAVNGMVGSSGNVYSLSYLFDDASATFTNTFTPPEGSDLTISKTVTGSMGDPNREFPFCITLSDQNGSPLSDLDIKIDLPDQTETVLTTDEGGVLTFRLKHGQKVTLQNLPQGTRYTITEDEALGYSTTFAVNDGSYTAPANRTLSGTLDGKNDVLVHVTNDCDLVVPTGIQTETQPYVLMLAFVLVAALLWITVKRRTPH